MSMKDLSKTKAEIRAAAAQEATSLRGQLYEKFPGVELGLNKISNTPSRFRGGEWDWWTQGRISQSEKARLRRNWMKQSAFGGSGPDVLRTRQKCRRIFGHYQKNRHFRNFFKNGKIAKI